MLDNEQVDVLVLVVVSDTQAKELGSQIAAAGFRYTIISATNSLLPAGSACLMIGTHSSRIDQLNGLVDEVCRTRRTYIPTQSHMTMMGANFPTGMIEAEFGSASVYILPVEYFEAF